MDRADLLSPRTRKRAVSEPPAPSFWNNPLFSGPLVPPTSAEYEYSLTKPNSSGNLKNESTSIQSQEGKSHSNPSLQTFENEERGGISRPAVRKFIIFSSDSTQKGTKPTTTRKIIRIDDPNDHHDKTKTKISLDAKKWRLNEKRESRLKNPKYSRAGNHRRLVSLESHTDISHYDQQQRRRRATISSSYNNDGDGVGGDKRLSMMALHKRSNVINNHKRAHSHSSPSPELRSVVYADSESDNKRRVFKTLSSSMEAKKKKNHLGFRKNTKLEISNKLEKRILCLKKLGRLGLLLILHPYN
eukprot:TRINITY_DN3586_c0_g1_i2.p1 TRINITY_DN3586_c0_g1~~TRINITY_DN3586_c0_g1_i2.p1  ORF type:complete len:322 (-),score=30.07 TRINITY_DN3586_c0_g1_i2:44-946(-)